MFRYLGVVAARRPVLLIGGWLVILAAVLALAPKLSDVVDSSRAALIPSSYNSQHAEALLLQAFPHAYARQTAALV